MKSIRSILHILLGVKVKVQQNTGIKYKSQQECMLNSSNQVSPSTWILLL